MRARLEGAANRRQKLRWQAASICGGTDATVTACFLPTLAVSHGERAWLE